MVDRRIVSAAIYPGIGIARVGSSEEYFIGPEVPDAPMPEGGYRDRGGELKRQAARFRVYGLDADGRVVAELRGSEADVSVKWRVHVANRKAAWYDFNVAMDIPQAVPSARRNASFQGAERERLVIDPGPAEIEGRDAHGEPLVGQFLDESVTLGQLHTDAEGRLVFVGGYGRSGSPFPGNTAFTFANNDGWHDDICDGWVEAEVTLGAGEHAKRLPCTSSWVAVTPPNYGTNLIAIVTIYDLLVDTFIGSWLAQPERPSFTRDIYPILRRFNDAQWVNKGFAAQFGWKGPNDFLAVLDQLSQSGEVYGEQRRQIFNMFRYPTRGSQVQVTVPDNRRAGEGTDINAWPWVYGDGVALFDPPRDGYLGVTSLQYQQLGQWAAGDFDADWTGAPAPVVLEDLPPDQQAETLTRTALDYCIGGPFHPGTELTWPIRHSTLYSGPFRIRRRAKDQPATDYGDVLMPQQVYDPNTFSETPSGPLFEQGPGDLTRWMAVPWQTDTSSCRSGYESSYDPYLPTFWPVRVPNTVLTQEDYRIVVDPTAPAQEREAAFQRRAVWYRFLGEDSDYIGQINRMMELWSQLGVVEPRPGVEGFPGTIYVETLGPVLQAKAEHVPLDRGKWVLSREKMTPKPGASQ